MVQVGVDPHPGVEADPPRVAPGVVAGVLEGVPGALEEETVLRVHQLGLARAAAEERGVEELRPLDHAAGAHVGGVGEEGRIDPRRRQLLGGEAGDELLAGAQPAPEFLDGRGAGEAPRHADDGDLPRRLLDSGAPRRTRRRGHRRIPLRAQEARQGAHRRVAEEVDHRQLAPQRLTEAGVDLRREQRVAAQVEEVVVQADLVDLQDLAPDRRDGALQLRARRRRLRPRRNSPGSRQRPAVHLAVGGQRQAVEGDEERGDERVGQALGQEAAQLGGLRDLSGEHRVGHQAVAAAGVGARHDHGLAHRRVGGERRLDLAELDTETADLDLVVETAEELDLPAGTEAGEVPGPVEPRAAPAAHRIGDEPLGREVRPAAVAARQAVAADQQLAGHPDRHLAQRGVEQIEAGVGDRPPDGHHRGPALPALHRVDRRPDGGLGRAVEVPYRRRALAQPLGQIAGQRLAAAEDGERRRSIRVL